MGYISNLTSFFNRTTVLQNPCPLVKSNPCGNLATLVIALKEKTHLLWWALRMCIIAVTLAPPIIQGCSTTKSFSELRNPF